MAALHQNSDGSAKALIRDKVALITGITGQVSHVHVGKMIT